MRHSAQRHARSWRRQDSRRLGQQVAEIALHQIRDFGIDRFATRIGCA